MAAPTTIFIGRERELAELDAILETDGLRLVTLWGPGGAGKTTIARVFQKREEEDTKRRVVWIDLAAARTESDLITTMAAALDVGLDSLNEHDDEAAITRSLAARDRALVICDNAEQLDEQARAAFVRIAEGHEDSEAPARLLVTSRDALGAKSEKTIRVDPLSETDALSLYTTLSGAASDDAAKEIVRRLDALPLAIELAAARVPVLGSSGLLARLDRKLDVLGGPGDPKGKGRPKRHATLRAAIGWSWDLLEEADRTTLMTCASFEGSFDAELAAKAAFMSADADDELTTMDALERLRQRALLHVGPADEAGRPSLYLLEAVRDFVRGEISLRADNAEMFFERHALAILDRTAAACARVRRGGAIGPDLARRRGGLLSASRPRKSGGVVSTKTAAQALIALAALLAVTGPSSIVVERADLLLEAEEKNELGPLLRARLAIVKGEALRAMGLHAEAEGAAAIALHNKAPLKDEALVAADATRLAGLIARSQGQTGRAIELLTDALERYQRDGERALAGICIGEIGAAYQSEGKINDALDAHAKAIAIHVSEGSTRAEGVERSYLAVATHRGGTPAASVALHEDALAIHRRVGHRRLEGAELLHLGFVHHELGAPGAARERLLEAKKVLAAAGALGLETLAFVFLARLEADEGNTAAARVALAEAHHRAPRGWPRLEGTRLVVEGHLALHAGDRTRAAEAYEAALALSRHVEVGFEALTPAYLAHARGPGPSSSALFEEARSEVERRVPNAHVKTALAILEGKRSTLEPAVLAAGASASSEVRRALAFAGEVRGIVLSDEAKRMILPDGKEVDLSRRKNVRLILLDLAKARRDSPGAFRKADDLIEAGWPGERMRADAGLKRLHTAIWTLRSLGLEDALLSSEEGYALDPKIRLDLD